MPEGGLEGPSGFSEMGIQNHHQGGWSQVRKAGHLCVDNDDGDGDEDNNNDNDNNKRRAITITITITNGICIQ